MDVYTAKYGVQTTFVFTAQKRGFPDFAATADWTPATGDTKVSKDAGAVANTTNNPAVVSGGVGWSLVLTATEMQAARLYVQIVDSATKAIEDVFFVIETFGNASAAYAFDLSVASPVVASVTGAVGSVTGAVGSVTGAVGSVTGAVGSVTGNVGGNVVGTVASVVGAVGSVTGAVASVTGNVGGNVTGSVGSVTTGGITTASFAAGAINAAAIATDAITAGKIAADAIGASELAADAATEIATAVWAATMTELASIPGVTGTVLQALELVFLAHRNKITQTATTTLLRNDADAATIGTSTVSDDGTTFTRGKFA